MNNTLAALDRRLQSLRGCAMGYADHAEYEADIRDLQALRDALAGGARVVPGEPTETMLVAARDWSQHKYGRPIGNDAARGCWLAMLPNGAPTPDEDGRCKICGCEFEDPALITHECPPAYRINRDNKS